MKGYIDQKDKYRRVIGSKHQNEKGHLPLIY